MGLRFSRSGMAATCAVDHAASDKFEQNQVIAMDQGDRTADTGPISLYAPSDRRFLQLAFGQQLVKLYIVELAQRRVSWQAAMRSNATAQFR